MISAFITSLIQKPHSFCKILTLSQETPLWTVSGNHLSYGDSRFVLFCCRITSALNMTFSNPQHKKKILNFISFPLFKIYISPQCLNFSGSKGCISHVAISHLIFPTSIQPYIWKVLGFYLGRGTDFLSEVYRCFLKSLRRYPRSSPLLGLDRFFAYPLCGLPIILP